MEYGLGVDLGTTYTAAAVRHNGHAEVARLGSRRAEIPSLVFVRTDGRVLIGEAAERRGADEPGRLAREFKRRVGDPVPLLVGGSPYSAHALMARLLEEVLGTVTRQQEGPPAAITVTHPANWGPYKRELLGQAVRLAELDNVTLRSEPEAAAVRYASTERVRPGEIVAVYDLGGGTFDAAVLRKTESGFELLGEPEGIEQLGGIDFDEAVLGHVTATLGQHVSALDPDDPAVMEALARLRRDCVEAKEALSYDTEVMVPVALPNLHTRIRLNRSEFETMITPPLQETVAAMRRTLRGAGVEPAQLRSILLAGGSSRIPLVSQLLSLEFRRPVVLDPSPEHSIALGAALVTGRGLPAAAQAVVVDPVAVAPTLSTEDADDDPVTDGRKRGRVATMLSKLGRSRSDALPGATRPSGSSQAPAAAVPTPSRPDVPVPNAPVPARDVATAVPHDPSSHGIARIAAQPAGPPAGSVSGPPAASVSGPPAGSVSGPGWGLPRDAAATAPLAPTGTDSDPTAPLAPTGTDADPTAPLGIASGASGATGPPATGRAAVYPGGPAPVGPAPVTGPSTPASGYPVTQSAFPVSAPPGGPVSGGPTGPVSGSPAGPVSGYPAGPASGSPAGPVSGPSAGSPYGPPAGPVSGPPVGSPYGPAAGSVSGPPFGAGSAGRASVPAVGHGPGADVTHRTPPAYGPAVPHGAPVGPAGPGPVAVPPQRAPDRRRRLYLVGTAVFTVIALVAAAAFVWIVTRESDDPDGNQPAAVGTWARKADLPVSIEGATMAAYRNKLWVAGGQRDNDPRTKISEVFVYDPATDRWDNGPPLPRQISHAALVPTPAGLYFIAGWVVDGGSTQVLRLNDEGTAWTEQPPLPETRVAGVGGFTGKEIIYAGGTRKGGGASNTVWALRNGAWVDIGKLHTPRQKLMAAGNGVDTLWILGGRDIQDGQKFGVIDVVTQDGVTRSNRVLDPPIDSSAAIYVEGSGVCLVGGQTPGGGFNDWWCEERGLAERLPPLDPQRGSHAAAMIDRTVYVVGGYGKGFVGLSRMESFTLPTT